MYCFTSIMQSQINLANSTSYEDNLSLSPNYRKHQFKLMRNISSSFWMTLNLEAHSVLYSIIKVTDFWPNLGLFVFLALQCSPLT